jgi:hypothetical protein
LTGLDFLPDQVVTHHVFFLLSIFFQGFNLVSLYPDTLGLLSDKNSDS